MDNQPSDLIAWYKTVKGEIADRSYKSYDLYDSSMTPRMTVTIISVISLISSLIDKRTLQTPRRSRCHRRETVLSMKLILLSLFQTANIMLFVAVIMESAALVQVYVWCTMSYVVLGLALTLLDFLLRVRRHGAAAACGVFLPDVAFLFVLFRCLPLVDKYARDIQRHYY